MVRIRTLASLVLLSVVFSGCALTKILREPDPIDPHKQMLREQQLEIHRMHHQQAVEAHEAAVRLHQQMATPTPAPQVP